MIEIQLSGRVPSKKNLYTPRKDGKGMFKSTSLQSEIDRLAMQVPGSIRDMKLRHPRVEFFFTVTENGLSADRDSKATCLLDILVQMGVIVDDNIRNFNGTMIIYPAVVGEAHWTKIIITENAGVRTAAKPSSGGARPAES